MKSLLVVLCVSAFCPGEPQETRRDERTVVVSFLSRRAAEEFKRVGIYGATLMELRPALEGDPTIVEARFRTLDPVETLLQRVVTQVGVEEAQPVRTRRLHVQLEFSKAVQRHEVRSRMIEIDPLAVRLPPRSKASTAVQVVIETDHPEADMLKSLEQVEGVTGVTKVAPRRNNQESAAP